MEQDLRFDITDEDMDYILDLMAQDIKSMSNKIKKTV